MPLSYVVLAVVAQWSNSGKFPYLWCNTAPGMIHENMSAHCLCAASSHRETCAIIPLARQNHTSLSISPFTQPLLTFLYLLLTALPPVSNSSQDFPPSYPRQDKSHAYEQESSWFSHPHDLQSEVTLGMWAGSIKPSGPVILNYSFVLQCGASLQSPALFPPQQTALSPCLQQLQLFQILKVQKCKSLHLKKHYANWWCIMPRR